jgi:hypothetical protein
MPAYTAYDGVMAILASPVKLARAAITLADNSARSVADYLVPEGTGASPARPAVKAASPKAEPASPRLNGISKKNAVVRASSKRRSSPQIKVKKEAVRDLPSRASRRAHKAGFYAEGNLTSIACATPPSPETPHLKVPSPTPRCPPLQVGWQRLGARPHRLGVDTALHLT